MAFLTMKQLGSLGQTADCGPTPPTGPGELKQCCPGIGWVIYDATESPYGICERAQAQITGETTSAAPLPDDPVARVQALRQQLEERRLAFEERRHQELLQEAQLRFMLGRVTAQQAAVAAREKAKLDAAAAERAARAKALAAAERQRKTKKALTWGVAALAAAKLFAVF